MVKINFNTGMPTSISHRGFKLQYSIASKCKLQPHIDTYIIYSLYLPQLFTTRLHNFIHIFILQLVIGRMTETMEDSLILRIPIMRMATPTAISLYMYQTRSQESLYISSTFCLETEEETVPMMLTSRQVKISNSMNKKQNIYFTLEL